MSGEGCFHGEEMATTREGPKMVKDIQQGEEVLATDKNGTIIWSKVFMQFHADNEEVAKATVIKTHLGKRIVLTTDHLIFASKYCQVPLFNLARIPFAKDVQEGDCVFTVGKTTDGEQILRLDKVISVKQQQVTGLYAPVTLEGTIIVSDVVASCYAILENHWYAHNIFAVFHYLPEQARPEIQKMFTSMSTFQLAKWLWSINDKITSVDDGVCFKRFQK